MSTNFRQDKHVSDPSLYVPNQWISHYENSTLSHPQKYLLTVTEYRWIIVREWFLPSQNYGMSSFFHNSWGISYPTKVEPLYNFLEGLVYDYLWLSQHF